jgi:hypothetical protein
VPLLLLLSGCKEVLQYTVGPLETAADCSVKEREFQEAKAKMKNAQPYSVERLGTCVMHVDDTRTIFIDTEEELRRFEQTRNAAGADT